MKNPFKKGYKITQRFGNNPAYYGQWGFAGHEGLDIIPQLGSWDVLAVEGGKVVRDIDAPRDNYGKYVVILNLETRRAWWYCHLASNCVSVGEEVSEGEKLGVMGATGQTFGAHLHLGLRLSDEDGNATNLDNGYKGFINPLPLLEQQEGGEEMDRRESIKEIYKAIYHRDPTKQEIDRWDESQKATSVTVAELWSSLEIDKKLSVLASRFGDLERSVNELSTKTASRLDSLADSVGQLVSQAEIERKILADASSKTDKIQETTTDLIQEDIATEKRFVAFRDRMNGLETKLKELLKKKDLGEEVITDGRNGILWRWFDSLIGWLGRSR